MVFQLSRWPSNEETLILGSLIPGAYILVLREGCFRPPEYSPACPGIDDWFFKLTVLRVPFWIADSLVHQGSFVILSWYSLSRVTSDSSDVSLLHPLLQELAVGNRQNFRPGTKLPIESLIVTSCYLQYSVAFFPGAGKYQRQAAMQVPLPCLRDLALADEAKGRGSGACIDACHWYFPAPGKKATLYWK